MARGQTGPKAIEELERAIVNYKIIIEEANRLDPSYECQHTQDIFYAIFKCCVPSLKDEVELLRIIKSHKNGIKSSIQDLDQLKLAKITKDIELDDNESHESPIVHLLYLAVEKQAISYSREHSLEGENWGRLAAFSGYLKERAFKEWSDENGAPYWPGLPTCIMIYVPIWTLQTNYHISFSATLDRFEYALATKKTLLKIRARRLHRLQQLCDADTRSRIDAIKLFSKELGDPSNWKTLFRQTSNIDDFGPHSWRPHHLKPHASVPFYLPIVNSTWYPSGKYLRACPLDSLRFAVLRPPEAEKVEQVPRRLNQKKPGKLLVPPESSCAEWDGFLDLMSRPQHKETVWY